MSRVVYGRGHFPMLKFLRKSRKNLYLVAFIIFFIWLISFDFVTEKSFNLSENLFRSILFIVVYAFVDWAWDSKNYNKKKE